MGGGEEKPDEPRNFLNFPVKEEIRLCAKLGFPCSLLGKKAKICGTGTVWVEARLEDAEEARASSSDKCGTVKSSDPEVARLVVAAWPDRDKPVIRPRCSNSVKRAISVGSFVQFKFWERVAS